VGQGVKMPPGTYRVTLRTDSVTRTAPLTIIGNPSDRSLTQADYDAQFAAASGVRDTISRINAALAQIRAQSAEHRAALATIEGKLVAAPAPGQTLVPARLLAHFGVLYSALVGDGGYGSGSAEGRPLAGVLARKRDLEAQWNAVRAALEAAMRRTIQ